MSIRNNEDRLGAKAPDESPPIPQTHQETSNESASVFSFAVPTEIVELPSGGKYYPEGHPLRGVDTIEIKHMTAKEEDILTSRSLLKKGVAIDRLLQSVLVDKRINPDDLLIGDKNALLVATRIVGYGADYETNITCPACATTMKNSFNLAKLEISEPKLGDGISKKGNNFLIKLPKTEVEVEVRLLCGRDEKFLAEATNMKRKNNLPDSALTDQIRMFVVAVNGHTDKQSINNFIESVPAIDSRHLRRSYEKVVPNIDMTQNFVCNNCSYDAAMEVPLSADFFWPK